MVKEIMDAKIAAAEAEVVELKKLAEEIEVEKKAAYDQGFTEGAASIGSDVVYTEKELQEKLDAAVAPLNVKLEELGAELEKVPAKLDAAVAEAKAAMKAELAAKYAEMQVAEQAAETGFAELLK